jgi:oxygen-dependent protoporphyrinogen oxidase
MGAELFVPPRHDAADESIGAFMTRRFGAEATKYLAEPLLAGIHAGDVDRLSLRALFPRFAEAEQRHGSLLKAFRRRERPGAPADDGPFRSLPGGLTELVGALVAALPSGSLHLRSSIDEISSSSDGQGVARVMTADGRVLHAPAVLVATPAYAAARLLRTVAPSVSTLCERVRYASAVTVALAFRRDAVRHPLNGSGFVVPRVEGSRLLAASWLSSKWRHRAPAGMVLMRTFLGGARDPRALELQDTELESLSLTTLQPLLGIDGPPRLSRVYRWVRASAQHEVGHLEWMQQVERALSAHPGLFVTGSGFRGVGIPDCVADARVQAGRLADWLAAAAPHAAPALARRAE